MDFVDLQTSAILGYYAQAFRGIVNGSQTDADITAAIKEKSPYLATLLQQGGAELFPDVAAHNAIAAAATATFDPDLTAWVQAAINKYLQSELDQQLSVDGHYGPETVAAVKQAQEKLSIPPDGYANRTTRDALAQKLGSQVKEPLT